MPVVANRAGNNVTVTITFAAGDIFAAVGKSDAEKKKAAFERAQQELSESYTTLTQTDAQLDAELAAHQAKVVAIKAKKPTGNL